jgi:hypothetical protein
MLYGTYQDVTNTYKLEAANPVLLRTLPEYFTFTTRDQDNFPVPFPKYIGIHAACAKVAYLSGATGYIDEQDRDMSVSKTLAPDGASASLLEGAIFGLQARG